MTYHEVRTKFIQYFLKRGHALVSSSSLIPEHDASVLFTTAGMQQFKPYYTGVSSPYGDRAISIQKCFRTSDIDTVGDESHLTFFEMFGNFAFNGVVSKKEAILWGWEFLTSPDWMNINASRLMASYYNGNRLGTFPDDEARQVLESLRQKGLTQIAAQPDSDNFWGPTGDAGPCGPTVEFYVDGVEIWNIVFNQFYFQTETGLQPAAHGLGIDTGMGLERLLVAVTPETTNVYETDAFTPIIDKIHDHTPDIDIGTDRSMRIVADHLRASVFLFADHVQPSNKEQGYLLRRILRRAILHLDKLEALAGFQEIIEVVIDYYSEFYPELTQEKDNIVQFAGLEKEKFLKTITQGREALEKKQAQSGNLGISGYSGFELFSTYGLPIDYIKEEEVARASTSGDIIFDSKKFDVEFNQSFAKHQDISRAGVESKFGGHGLASGAEMNEADRQKITRYHTVTHLLHAALMKFLGSEVKQAGSDLNTERARFDFTFPRPLTDAEKTQVEDWVNEQIKKDLLVKKEIQPLTEALAEGAVAFFREKYPDPVNVYTIYNEDSGEVVSKELCGGPHVARTSEIGKFKIIKEQSSSAGVRRIRATIE